MLFLIKEMKNRAFINMMLDKREYMYERKNTSAARDSTLAAGKVNVTYCIGCMVDCRV